MDNENVIRLSGPFDVTDSSGRVWHVHGIRIFDEGYAIIDVYVDFMSSMEDEPLHDDAHLIAQIMARLHALGYDGPDFGPGVDGLQDDNLIVLEAPEAFGRFAAGKGWKNLAEEFDADDADAESGDIMADPVLRNVYVELMRKLGVR